MSGAFSDLEVLPLRCGSVFLQFDTAVISTGSRGFFLEIVTFLGSFGTVQVFLASTVEFLFEDRVLLNGLEFGLEVVEVAGGREGVAAAARVGHIITIVFKFVALTTPAVTNEVSVSLEIMRLGGILLFEAKIVRYKIDSLPIALSTTVLLGLFGVSVYVTGLGKVAREMFFGSSGTVSKANVITVVMFVATSHFWNNSQFVVLGSSMNNKKFDAMDNACSAAERAPEQQML
ncbi:MAG: hypothetical protein M1820_004886 [Bogoriella megaspora]|nr:MAG: hypothetical protein M1820_004886 [Bogoriella megaspora]